MFRISLIKNSTLVIGWLFCSYAFAQDIKIPVVDQNGNPVLHAYATWESKKMQVVDNKGLLSLPTDLPELTPIIVKALGYEGWMGSYKDLAVDTKITLQERIGLLGEVVVSATRTTRSVADLPMPVVVINRVEIEKTGGMRLSEVLSEQTGLQIVANHGNGLQMQGLSSEYILILMDGEPLVGRTAGTFNLDRMSTANIERIEILRGPSSAIYGSEAMAGVINIVTRKSTRPFSARLDFLHRSFGTTDITGEAAVNRNGWHFSSLVNQFRTQGYDLTPDFPGFTQAPFQGHTGQVKVGKRWDNKWEFALTTRLYNEESENIGLANRSGQASMLDMEGRLNELNLQPTLTFRPSSQVAIHLRGISSNYATRMNTTWQEDGQRFDFQEFDQWFHRTEAQTDWQMGDKHLLSMGMGYQFETVEATRYDDKNRFDMAYAFLQHQWSPGTKWQVVTGARFDAHNTFGQRLSPKISAQYRKSEQLSFQASLGAGFKTPDFRQMLLNFNNAAAGYFVFGSLLAQDGIARLQESGQIAQILIPTDQIGALNAETSQSINLGTRWLPRDHVLVNVNLFHNSISNLIEAAPIARLSNGQNAFSYFNISRVTTTGAEIDLTYRLNNQWSASIGYAYLDTRDLDVVDAIEEGRLFRRNEQNRTVQVNMADYGGLFNRSRNSGNVKISWQDPEKGWNIALRGIYRGPFGFGDINGNLILDDPREFAPGILSANLRVSKRLTQGMEAEAGGFNLLNQVTIFQPNNPGRTYFAGLRISLDDLIQTKNK